MRWFELNGWAIDTSLVITGILLGQVWFWTGYLFGRRR